MDNWHPLGPFYGKIGDRVVNNVGRSLRAKVASIIAQGMWRWPRLRNPLIQAIIAQTPPSLRPNSEVEDYVLWLPHPSGNFTAKSSWNPIRDRYPIQPWHIIIWRNNVPRWSFVLWLAVLRSLSTKDRLKAWGMQIDGVCCLCNFEEETQEHFFF